MNNPIFQERTIAFLQKYPDVGVMIPIYGHTSMFGSDAFFQCCLVPHEVADDEMKTDCTNRWSSCVPGFTRYGFGDGSDIVYHRYGNGDGFESLIIQREFDGLGIDDEIEISEEFRLLNNLYYDRAKNEHIDLDADTVVIKVDKDFVTVHKGYLVRYLAAKNMTLLVHLDSNFSTSDINTKLKRDNTPIDLDGKNVSISFGLNDYTTPKQQYSLLYAKIPIYGCSLEDCGYWPFSEMSRGYEDFIVGVDELGKEISFSSNPDNINKGGQNRDKPDYFTLVFFKREVLQKYYDAPDRYYIGDGILKCGGRWLLYIDNQSPDYVSAYLGDLGRDLPSHQEQKHWKQYNIAIDGKLSKSKWARDFGSIFSAPDSPVFIFQNKYSSLSKLFEKKMGWELFLPLKKEDAYNITGLRVPLTNAQPEFDMQILCLVKVLIDSLNEKMITTFYDNSTLEIKGSIAKLEKMFEVAGVQGAEAHISFLRNLQELRSTGTGHRKGKSYEKAAKRFGLPENEFRRVFDEIVKDAISFLDFINDNADSIVAFQNSNVAGGKP
jgi:hypothetical protein